MGILGSVRGRLGLGGSDDYYRDEYGQDDYGDYEEYADEQGYDAVEDRRYERQGSGGATPAAMKGFGVDRADYYNDSHSPLVSLSDVRSHRPEPTGGRASARPRVPSRVAAQPHDRIPEPRAYRRVTNMYEGSGLDEDAVAFKDGLARGDMNSLTQLQTERLRLEDTGRFGQIADPSASDPADPAEVFSAESGIISGRVRPRGRRRIEYLSPLSYAEAEQVTKRLKGGSVVVLDLTQVRPELAKRILDFSFGVASALDGQVDRYADRVYIFTAKTALTSEERASIRLEL